ncbi:hypothetical protein BH09MYX1_BH09MYX1_10060 [soil metagenome]
MDAAPDRRRPDASPDSAAIDSGKIPCSVAGYWLDDAYDPTCGFCYAKSKADLPPPITWMACDSFATPNGMVCRQMVEDWGPGLFGSERISAAVRAWVQPNGVVTLMLGRLENPFIHRLVADADGPVHQAVVETQTTCTLGNYDIGDGKVAYRVYDSEVKGKLNDFGGGALGGDMNDLRPRVFLHYHGADKYSRTYYASSLGLFEIRTPSIQRYDWVTGAMIDELWPPSEVNGFAVAHLWPSAGVAFWDAYAGLSFNKLRVWTEDGGGRDFISYGNDPSQGASDFGTDGEDMVWNYCSDRYDGGITFPKNDVMTAPFTTDPTLLVPRRLRSDGTQFGTTPFVVGCGFAAHASTVVPGETGLLLVRLSDGRSWTLTTPSGPWIWTEAIALTCTELFALVRTKAPVSGTTFTVARVRLDSLGPGLAPD